MYNLHIAGGKLSFHEIPEIHSDFNKGKQGGQKKGKETHQ